MSYSLIYDANSFAVINALNNFANITLSSLYFDITKDCLYADGVKSRERRAVVTVLEQVYIISLDTPSIRWLDVHQILATLTSVMAPVLPYLAEEIHHVSQGVGEDMAAGSSIFMRTWIPLVNVLLYDVLPNWLTDYDRAPSGKITKQRRIWTICCMCGVLCLVWSKRRVQTSKYFHWITLIFANQDSWQQAA